MEDLEIITQVSQTEKDKYHMISFICEIFFNDPNELIYKIQKDPQIQKTNLWLPKGKRGDKLGVWY